MLLTEPHGQKVTAVIKTCSRNIQTIDRHICVRLRWRRQKYHIFIELYGYWFGSCATWDALQYAPVSFQVLIMVLPAAMLRGMEKENTGKRIARVRTHLTKRTVEALASADKSWIAWDDRLKRPLDGIARQDAAEPGLESEGWLFPAPRKAALGHVSQLSQFYPDITRAGGTRFWFHGLRNAFITVAERELMLPRSLTKRLVNHARPSDVTGGYAADWTVEQLREPAQRVADRIDELTRSSS